MTKYSATLLIIIQLYCGSKYFIGGGNGEKSLTCQKAQIKFNT